MVSIDASQVIAGLKVLIANPPTDKATRQELDETLKTLSTVIEDPHDTIYRIAYSPLNLTYAVVATDLKIFEVLAASDTPLTVESLAKTQNCDAVLMGRILRFLASQRMVTEVDEDTFTANNVTRSLSKPGFAAGLRHNFDAHMPSMTKVPQFLADNKYANPSDSLHSAFQIAFQTDLPQFVWGLSQPNMVQDFQLWMAAVYGDRPTTWLDVFDMSKHCSDSKADDVVFVDVAGGIGHQCALLKAKLPKLEGRVTLEDLPMVLPHAIPTPGVDTMGIDMWQGQPVEGAKTYYMRMILHDYPDDKAIDLLKLTAEAMSKVSILIIDELVIPNKGAHAHATQFDMTMMAGLSSLERTDRQWDALLEEAGFKVLEKKAYSPTGESVIITVPRA